MFTALHIEEKQSVKRGEETMTKAERDHIIARAHAIEGKKGGDRGWVTCPICGDPSCPLGYYQDM